MRPLIGAGGMSRHPGFAQALHDDQPSALQMRELSPSAQALI